VRFRQDPLIAIAQVVAGFGAVILGALLVAATTGSHVHLLSNAVFWIGVVCLGGGMLTLLVLTPDRTAPDADHVGRLQTMLGTCRTHINANEACPLADPPSEETGSSEFSAHFPRLVRQLQPWNATVRKRKHAHADLTSRFKTEAGQLHDPAYRTEIIARGLTAVTARRALTSTLDASLVLDPRLPGTIWTCFVVDFPPDDGLRIDNSQDWAVKMTGIPPGEIYNAEADRLMKPINDLLTQAQTWTEAEALKAAGQAVKDFDREALQTAIQQAEKNRNKYKRRCPGCRAP
jgi:hypothetical protein